MAYRDTIIADSPAGYYRLDESSGTAFADSSGNSNTLTLSNVTQVTYAQSGLLTGDINKCIKTTNSCTFYGTVASPPTTLTTGFTTECWFNCPILPTGGNSQDGPRFIHVTATNTWDVYLYSSSGGQPLQVRIDVNSYSYYVSVNINTVYHIVCCYDGSYFDVYLNNSIVSHVARTSNYSGAVSSFNIVGFTGYYQRGVIIDEFAYYTRALTTDEIAKHYGYGNGSLIDPHGDSRPILRPRFDPTTQSIHRLGL